VRGDSRVAWKWGSPAFLFQPSNLEKAGAGGEVGTGVVPENISWSRASLKVELGQATLSSGANPTRPCLDRI